MGGGELGLSILRVRRMVVKELRQLFRDPKTKRIIFVAPVMQLLLFGYAVNTDVHDVATFVVDQDRTPASRRLLEAFMASESFRPAGGSRRAADLTEAIDRGEAIAGIQIPPGFGRDLVAGKSPAIQVIVDGTNSNTATVALGYAEKIARSHGARIADEAGRLPTGIVDIRARAWFNPSLESKVYNVPAVIGVIVLLMCLLLTALAVVREREIGTLEQLLVSPLSAGELMLGKTLPVAGIALAQLGMITTVALLWFDVPFRGSAPALLLAAALYILAGLSFGLLISTLSRTQQEAFLAIFLFFFPAIILSGFLYPVETMPEIFQRLTLANPLRHFLEIVRGVFLKGAGVGELRTQFLVLAGMAAAILLIATHRFRRSVG